MDKPTPKTEVKIDIIHKSVNVILLYGTFDAISDFKEFGEILKTNIPGRYQLNVNPQYNFDEVVAYIRIYGSNDA